jgi:peptidyl-prolyl cis-trans isomerase C
MCPRRRGGGALALVVSDAAMRRPFVLVLAATIAFACGEKPGTGGLASGSASSSAGGLPPELAKKPIAKVGDRVITLGEYAATLDRMDQFERLRYQTPERRKQLLQEMIDAELLATEARKRGLDKQPEVEERTRQLLRDELLRDLRRGVTPPGQLPDAEVRAYYEEHKQEFDEPERRRVAVIAFDDQARATQVLAKAKTASAADWGKLVKEHSVDKEARVGATAALELAGDLGITTAPGVTRGENARVPAEVRRVAFTLGAIGDVAPEVVRDGARVYIVKLTGKTEARRRSYADAERNIRITLVQKKLDAAEKQLETELRQRFPVKVDDAALAEVKLPAPDGSAHPPPALSR